jgi:hypothetical protein
VSIVSDKDLLLVHCNIDRSLKFLCVKTKILCFLLFCNRGTLYPFLLIGIKGYDSDFLNMISEFFLFLISYS